MVSKGNAFTDSAAKQAAKSQQIANMLVKEKNEEQDNIAALQEAAEESEKAKWEKIGCCYNAETKLWVSKEGQTWLTEVAT